MTHFPSRTICLSSLVRLLGFFLSTALLVQAKEPEVVIYGASPAGIMAAVAASREGAAVVLIEPSRWVGGLVAGGLSKTDVGNAATIGGLAREFFERCGKEYPGQPIWYAEPHVYQRVFAEMLKESGAQIIIGQRVRWLHRSGWTSYPPTVPIRESSRIDKVVLEDGREIAGKVFIDASYEGDLMAQAGVSFIAGREGRAQYSEELAGFRLEKPREFPLDTMTQGCACVGGRGPHYVHGAPTRISALRADGSLLWGVRRSTAEPGSADGLTQSYNFRLCVTRTPENRVPWPKPRNYAPEHYELLLRLIETYPGIPFSRLVHLGDVPGGKYDLNAQGLFSTDYVSGNDAYPNADAAGRERIRQDHLDYVQGFFWFLAHDERVPKALREETAGYGLCRDEFTDNAHWPYALYVREARRMIGEYVMTQRDVQRDTVKTDTVGMGSFIIDSHIVQRIVSPDGIVLDEGAFDAPTRPYQIPYRSLIPRAGECENLLVPVCLSASHVAYGSIRMEPVYMAMGHASGVAAVEVLRAGGAVQKINVAAVQSRLREQKAVLELKGQAEVVWAESLPGVVMDDDRAAFTGAWATSGYGNPIGGGARNDANAGKGEKSARYELTVPAAGRYEVRVSYTPAPNRATNVPVAITHADGKASVTLNQRTPPSAGQHFSAVGTYRFEPGRPAVVEIQTTGTDGFVAADCVQLLPAR
jgi:hypothetical protein